MSNEFWYGFLLAMAVAIVSALLVKNKRDTFKEWQFRKGSSRAKIAGKLGARVKAEKRKK